MKDYLRISGKTAIVPERPRELALESRRSWLLME